MAVFCRIQKRAVAVLPLIFNLVTDGSAGDMVAAGGAEVGSEMGLETHDCRHGKFDSEKKRCMCDPGWSTAGITDTVDFLEGVCEQFHCTDDQSCAAILGIPGALCPVKGWNCYCGLNSYAFENAFHGHETDKAECMGLMYALSIAASEAVEYYWIKAWYYFAIVAAVLIPFGRKRMICDHHRPSLWTAMRGWCGCRSTCQGQCVAPSESYSQDMMMDDLAWSIFVIDLGIWTYCFTFVVYVVFLFIWSVVLWALVIIILVVACIAMVCMSLGEGADCLGGCCDGGCGDCAGCDCCVGGAATDGAVAQDTMFYYGGPYPYDPFWGSTNYGGYHTSRSEAGQAGCCYFTCFPIFWLLYVCPRLPENAWGGMVGKWMGTHISTPTNQTYTGGNWIIDFLGFPFFRRGEVRENDDWRERVFEFLNREFQGFEDDGPRTSTAVGRPNTLLQQHGNGIPEETVHNGQTVQVLAITNRARAVLLGRPFGEDDNLVESAWTDYRENECWICRDVESASQWDCWLSCRHVFCSNCSGQMLQRRMPCPLCRVASSTVLRAERYSPYDPVPPL